MPTNITRGALHQAQNSMDPVIPIDTETPVEFTTRLSTERPRRWRVQRAEHDTTARVCITGPETILREHLEALANLTINDLIGEEDASTKLPRGLHIQLVEIDDITTRIA